MVKELKTKDDMQLLPNGYLTSLFLMFVQIICSCLAGVYNEYLLKRGQGLKINIYVQNIYMYIDSILCNIVLWIMVEYENKHNPSEIDLFKNKMVCKIFYRNWFS